MSCLPHMFSRKTNSEFLKISTSLAHLFSFGFFSHMNMIYQSFFWILGIYFSWKYVMRSSKGNKQPNILFCPRNFFFQIFWFCFCFLRTKWVNKNKTYISVSCSPNVFTKNEFRIFTNHNSSCLCLLIISIWFMKFFLWKFGILFSWKYVVRSTRINKKKVLGLNKAFEMVTKIRIWGEGFFLL